MNSNKTESFVRQTDVGTNYFMKSQVIKLLFISFIIFSCKNDVHKEMPVNKSVDKIQSELVHPKLQQYKDSLSNYGQGLETEWLRNLWLDTSLFFPINNYKKVIGYTFNKGIFEIGNQSQSVLNKDSFLEKNIQNNSIILNDGQISELLSILNDTSTYEWFESCIVPHQVFVFYDECDSIIGFVEIDLNCHELNAHPFVPIMKWGGLSNLGNTQLIKFCESIGQDIYLDRE